MLAAVNYSRESCTESNSFRSGPSSFIFFFTKDILDKLNFKCMKLGSILFDQTVLPGMAVSI